MFPYKIPSLLHISSIQVACNNFCRPLGLDKYAVFAAISSVYVLAGENQYGNQGSSLIR